MNAQARQSILFVLIIILTTFLQASAQNETGFIDVIHLKNGSVIKGKILDRDEQNDDYSLRLENGDIISIQSIHVKKIEEESVSPNETLLVEPVFKPWWTLLEAGVALGLGDLTPEGAILENRGLYPNIHVVNIFMLGRHTSMGIGIGYQNYAYGNMMPVFLDFRAYVGRKALMPMAVINAGYSFGWPKNENEPEWAGIFINPGIGAAYKLPSGTAIFMRLGYKLHRIGYEIGYDLNKINTSYLSLRFGVKF